ncbi:MAG: cation:proton antiporter [Beutenbergiaceae bacterium]
MHSSDAIVSLFWIACAVAASPLVVKVTRGVIPDVVVLLALGAVIGPSLTGVADVAGGVELLREVGLGLLFLIAGSEIDPATLKSTQGKHAALTWVFCVLVGLGVAWVFIPDADFYTSLVLALAITSTALGALLPILTDRDLTGSRLGTAVLTHGAVGELGPILAMALLLGSRSTLVTALVLVAFAAVTIVVAVVPRAAVARVPGLRVAILDGMHGTRQTGMRLIFWLLLTLMAAAAVFELDVVLGAFAAGLILRRAQPRGSHFLHERVEVVAWSFLVPVFFVTSGMNVDVQAIAERPLLLLVFVVMILGVRGGVVMLRERLGGTGSGLTSGNQRIQLGLYSAAGLPIIVAVTELATSRDLMPQDIAAVLVAAGALTLLVFPLLAQLTAHRAATAAAD